MTYTREQILSMPAGKELDKIAANAIGYVSLTTHLNSDGTFGLIPRYSTDISAAWELVEKLEKEVTVRRYKGMVSYWYWCRINGSEINRFDEKIAKGKSAPEAITKVAILSMMEGDKDE